MPGKARPSIDPVRVLRQHILGMIVALILGAILGLLAYFLFVRFYPLYRSEVLFEIRPGLSESTEIGTSESLNDNDVERMASTQTKLLMQREVLDRAIRNPQVRETVWMKTWFTDKGGQPLYDMAVDELEQDLATPMIYGSNLFAVRWSWHEPSDIPKVLDSIADAYMRKLEALDEAQFSENENLFDEQLRILRMGLQDISDEIQAFIVAKGITTLDDPRFSQTAIEVEALSRALTESQQDLTSAQTQYQQTALKLEGTVEPTHDDILQAETDPALHSQIVRLESLRAEERSLREKFSEDTPQVEQIERLVRGTQKQVEAKKQEVLNRNLNAQMRIYDNEVDRILKVIERLESELEAKDTLLRDLAADTSRYQAMVTQRSNLESQRDDVAQLLTEIRVMKLRSDAGRIRQLGSAEMPRQPTFPEIEVVLPAGVLLTVAAFVGWVFLREITEKRVRTLADLAVVPNVTPLGLVPDIADDPLEPDDAELVVEREPSSVTAESCGQLWVTIARKMGAQGHNTLVLAGGMPGAGTTTVISNLACAARAGGHSVCVVDANFRRPRLAEVMEVGGERGLGDLLAGSEPAGSVVQMTSGGIGVIAAGSPASRLVERLGDQRMGMILADLRNEYDFVLIDVAPAVAAGDAVRLAGRCDCSALVVRAGNEERGLIARLAGQLSDASAEFIGGMLNRPRHAVGGYFRKNYEVMASYGPDEDDEEDDKG